ncbi:MAG: hypothetical protein RLO17_08975 [Cyclobacteriaceae bacterium]
MRSTRLLPIFLILFVACGPAKKESTERTEEMMPKKASYKLEKQWETDTLLRTPESVLYDTERDIIYVANVNMNPWEKDGNGFISKISPTGEIVDLKWVTGFNGPKGMALVGSSLFVADLDELVEIDVTTGEVKSKTLVEGASGMNDISADDQGTLFISDSNGDKIFKYADGKAELYKEGLPGRPNGQLVVGSHLFVAFSGAQQFHDIDLTTDEMTLVTDSIGHGDGITPTTEAGVYLVSDWQGEIFIIGDEIGKQSLLHTKNEKKNTADIWFMMDQELVLVPTFFDNRVVAYKLIKS